MVLARRMVLGKEDVVVVKFKNDSRPVANRKKDPNVLARKALKVDRLHEIIREDPLLVGGTQGV
jgi:hypothetical protein